MNPVFTASHIAPSLFTHQHIMEGATAARTHVLSLYRNFLRYGNKFASYNFRDYAIRRSRDAFRAHQNETNPDKINQLIQKAETELQVVKRQATISQLYTRGDRLVVEKP